MKWIESFKCMRYTIPWGLYTFNKSFVWWIRKRKSKQANWTERSLAGSLGARRTIIRGNFERTWATILSPADGTICALPWCLHENKVFTLRRIGIKIYPICFIHSHLAFIDAIALSWMSEQAIEMFRLVFIISTNNEFNKILSLGQFIYLILFLVKTLLSDQHHRICW